MRKSLTPEQVQAGLDAMTPEQRHHIVMKAAMMRPISVDSLLKRRGGQPNSKGRVI
jgi:hypothetical protein